MTAEITIFRDSDNLPAFPEGSLSATGMSLPDNMPFEQWTRCGQSLQQMERSIMWWVGDWLNYGERSYGEMYAQAVGATGYENGTLRDAKWVASRYEMSVRIDNLSFLHHRIVAALPVDERTVILAEAEREGWSCIRLRREAQLAKKNAEKSARALALPKLADRYQVFCSDIDFAEIEPDSIDAIITDPPYPGEFLHLFDALASRAEEWLKPGGVLAVMSGQAHLPEVYRRLTGGLTYRWTFTYLTPGGQAVQIFPRCINTFWKPVIVYVKGDPSTCEWAGDVTRSDVNDNDKEHHHWGQSVSGMSDLVNRLTRVGDLILDPFMGAGTTGVSALLSERRFVGFDIDQQHVDTAASRLLEAANAAV